MQRAYHYSFWFHTSLVGFLLHHPTYPHHDSLLPLLVLCFSYVSGLFSLPIDCVICTVKGRSNHTASHNQTQQ